MSDSSQDKREAILNTALTLFMEKGFHETPTSLISKQAGVATGTVFFYFKTKEDLIDTLYCRIKNEAAQAMSLGFDKEKTSKENLHEIGRNAIIWGLKNPTKLKFMEQFAHSSFVSNSAYEEGMSQFSFLEELVKEGIQKGEIRKTDPPIILGMMASALLGLSNHVLLTNNTADHEKIISDGLDIIWYGMGA